MRGLRSPLARLGAASLPLALAAMTMTPAYAATFGTPAAGYTAGGVAANGSYYARSGSTLTLTVNTDTATHCVQVEGVTPFQTFAGTKTVWTFSVPAAAATTADGVQNKIVTIGEGNNGNGCNQKVATTTASYVLDNTGPSVSVSLNPAANAAGWNNATTAVTWTANDGTGVRGGTVTGITTVSADTAGQTVSGSATDALGNNGPTGSVVVKRDTAKPAITGSRAPAANGFGWNNTDVTVSFSCSDALSQIKSCVAGGTSPAGASRTLTASGANQSVGGTATDNADNTQTASVGGINIDKLAPSVTASATVPGGPNGTPYTAGTWTNQNVTVAFACSDALSTVDTCDGPTVLKGEGADQSLTGAGRDKAGNLGSGTFSDIDIDKTAPTTTASAPTAWNNTDVTVSLAGSDALSGVKSTHYSVNGGATQTGTSLSFSAEGSYTVSYWSVDNAGNTEAAKTATVKIDKTPPTINHTQSPAKNDNGWNNTDVAVTFTCGDSGGSGVASCGPNTTVSTEGKDQPVIGTAADNAGNTTTDPATVSIDKTEPSATATVSSLADKTSYGWYSKPVTVSYECLDDLGGSGIDTCSAADTLGEGADQSATGAARDAAGNIGSAAVSGINVDTTAPALTGTSSTTGWTNDNVTVTWACTDAGSGPVAQPAVSTVTGEGDDLSATATCTDKAGNSTTKTVAGIRIDRAAPNTTAAVATATDSGWYADSVDVTLSASDALSDVAATYYSIDGDAAVKYAGTFTLTEGGEHTVSYWSVDNAGNAESGDGNTLALWIDNADPTISGSRSPAANGYGWNNTPVTVSFACDDTQSGVASCTDPTPVSGEGAHQTVTGSVADGVGKTANATVGDINIDQTVPTLTGVLADDNAGGWYSGNVTVRWQGTDGGSGIDPLTQPTDSTITGEGRNLGAGPMTIADKAGNVSAQASVSGVMIDRTAPGITSSLSSKTAPVAGWYRDGVVVDYTCVDPKLADGTDGSGVASCPTSDLVKGDGANQSVTSKTAVADNAGNTGAVKVTSGINIDGTAPSTTSNNQCTKTNGYCTGSTANVVLTAVDQAGLSGVKEIHYAINGGAEQVAAGAAKTVAVPLDGSGAATVSYYAVDNAGNIETTNSASLKWDNIAPTVSHTLTPEPNADDWNNGDVTVHFNAKDDDAGSGVASKTSDVIVSTETAGLLVDGQATDNAGNVGTDAVTVKLDKTAPSITSAVVNGTVGSNGWYTSPVKVHFTCSDPAAGNGAAGSGLPPTACPDDYTFTANGTNQSVTRNVTDAAGNTASVTVSGISIDANLPTITSTSVKDGAVYTAIPAAPACTADDSDPTAIGGTVSGVDSCTLVVTAGAAAGDYSFTATAKDKAGNTSSLSGKYHVNVYKFSGFLQPINDPSIQPGTAMSVVKTGSTVPVKFQLRDAGGNLIQAKSLPAWIVPVKGSLTTASVNETAATDIATTDGYFRWDSTSQQYIYNWSTKGATANYNYKIGVKFDDGQTYYVTVGLR